MALPLARAGTRIPRCSSAWRTVNSKRSASHGAPHYNEPTGHLFGEKPLAPGEKRKREDWEVIWYLGMFGGMGLAAVGLYYKPDKSISKWAMEEAKQRMEARGEATSYSPSR